MLQASNFRQGASRQDGLRLKDNLLTAGSGCTQPPASKKHVLRRLPRGPTANEEGAATGTECSQRV